MKISKKEKLLLIMLVTILLSVIYYQAVYVSQREQLAQLEVDKQEIKARYDQVMETISTLEQRQERIEQSYLNISEESKEFYPTLVQEQLIIELDQLLTEHLIEANISFTQGSVAVVEAINSSEMTNVQSSLQPLVDQYSYYSEQSSETTTLPEGNDVVSSSQTTVEQMKISISFNATYANLKSFIQQLEQYERQIVITNLSVTPGLDDAVSGSMSLEVYAFPKFKDVDQQYLQWQLNDTYGKETPFSLGSATGMNEVEGLEEDSISSEDFVVFLKSSTSELPNFMMGLASDKERDSYITSDNEGIEAVTLTLIQNGDKYFYKYANSSSSHPISGDGLEFNPGESVTIKINSENRVTVDDQSGIRLNVINQIDKAVNVVIEADDVNPRVTVVGEGNPINVTKK